MIWARATLVAGLLFLVPAAASAAPTEGKTAGYVGSEACAACHADKHALWAETLHANVIKDARKNPEAVLGDFSNEAELGFSRADVLYTVGSHWDQRYMTMRDGDLYVLPKLWAVQSNQWRPYNVWSWKKRPWSRYCAGCHVTGYEPGNGLFSEMRIGCESCHGPGQEHAASEDPGTIIDPADLDQDRRDMICAACHVRGKDPTGEFFFPIGYRPGEDLGATYTPIDVEEGESAGDAIKRLWKAWAVEREETGRGKCEVCGIYGSSKQMEDKMKMSDQVTGYCLKCHEFGEQVSSHTHHPEEAKLACLDCHRPKPFSLEKETVDVHSVKYYRIHQESCYDENVESACISCHTHTERDLTWALRQILVVWKSLPELDH